MHVSDVCFFRCIRVFVVVFQSESQDQVFLRWTTGETATMHILVVHAMVILLTLGPPKGTVHTLGVTFTFSHLADAFIQSHLQLGEADQYWSSYKNNSIQGL